MNGYENKIQLANQRIAQLEEVSAIVNDDQI